MAVIHAVDSTSPSTRSGQIITRVADGTRLWAAANDGALKFFYSDNEGATWTQATTTLTDLSLGDHYSIFIDEDDYLHVFYRRTFTSGYYRRGTPNGNDWSFSATTAISNMDGSGGDVIAHREGTGWKVHMVHYFQDSGSTSDILYYTRLNITSGGTITADVASTAIMTEAHAGAFGSGAPKIMMRREAGDDSGKIPHASPDLYVSSVMFGNFAADQSAYYVAAIYSAGPTWTWGSKFKLQEGMKTSQNALHSATWDGTNMWTAWTYTTSPYVYVNRTTPGVGITTLNPGALGSGEADGVALSYDPNSGDIHLYAGNATDGDVYENIYDVSGAAWGGWTKIVTTTLDTSGRFFNATRFPEGNKIQITYSDTSTSPDEFLSFQTQAFNSPPTCVIDAPEDGVSKAVETELVLRVTYSDTESDDMAYYTVRRVIDALTTEYFTSGGAWTGTEGASTKIAKTVAASASFEINLGRNWADATTDSLHQYSVKVWDDTSPTESAYDTIDLYPSSSAAITKGFSMPRPYKKQENLLATLKSNNDYTLAWVNNYVPSYGDLNDDLYLKAGIRPADESVFRDAFPPVVGEFSLGNGTNFFANLGATNVYRTNELALSSEDAKVFYESLMANALGLVLAVPVEEFAYKDAKRNTDSGFRFGIVLEDMKHTLKALGIGDSDSAFVIADEDGNEFLNETQLIYVLWQAVQELYDMADPSGRRRDSVLRRTTSRVREAIRPKKNRKN